MTNIDTSEAAFTRTLREVVQAEPTKVYQRTDDGCVYADGDQPSCLIGQVLFRLGVSVRQLQAFDSEGADAGASSAASAVLRNLGFPEKVAQAARVAQAAQDVGLTWGAALHDYEQALEFAG